MKFILIPYIAIGFILSLVFGIEYNCNGSEMFPDYYGSPFIFKQKSLGSSMTYYYSISGLVTNLLLWSVLLYLVHKGIDYVKTRAKNPIWLNRGYQFMVGFLLVFSSFHIALNMLMLGNGFDQKSNYWYWDVDEEASQWGVICEGQWISFSEY